MTLNNPAPDRVDRCRFPRNCGAPCAALVNCTAHPVIAMLLSQVCADYPGAASPTAAGKDGTITRLALKLAEGPLRGEIQAMRLGPIRWVSLPGEPFVETGLALKKAGASFMFGYANGYLGYFPIQRAYDDGGYEVLQGACSRVAPGSAERLQSLAAKLLHRA